MDGAADASSAAADAADVAAAVDVFSPSPSPGEGVDSPASKKLEPQAAPPPPPSDDLPPDATPPATLSDDLRDKIVKQLLSPGEGVDSPASKKLEPQAAPPPPPSDDLPPDATPPATLSDDLRDKIVKQVEYYFSDENLPSDTFMLKQIKKNKNGFVPIGIIASFRKMKKLIQDNALVAEALKSSNQLVVSSDAKQVRRLNPLPKIDTGDEKLRTVIVKNLPEDYSMENMRQIFGAIGGIKDIQIHEPQLVQERSKPSRKEMLVCGKLHALIEYDTVEAAEKAAKSLNDDQNWRSGMRVELLLKRTGKYGLASKGWKNRFEDKDVNPVGEEQNVKTVDLLDQLSEEETLKHLPNEKTGRHSHRGKSCRDQVGQGHGTALTNRASNKPFPGPKMPDGTRGFSMGRGKRFPSV